MRIIGKRYELLEEIGAGSMGAVYRSLDRLTGETIALKQVHVAPQQLQYGSRGSDGDIELTLAQEFKILASLRHPNIISVLDYGFDAPPQAEYRAPYITMELLADAVTILDAADGQSESERVDLLVQMLEALAYLHRRGVLHRDLKPKNVMVVEGHVKVLDFGLSIMSGQAQSGEIAGTPSYMAPELWNGEPASRQSDLYAVGVIAYRMFAGAHPFDTRDLTILYEQVKTQPPDLSRLHANADIAHLIGRLLAKDAADRPSDVTEVIGWLRAATGRAMPPESAAARESYLQAAAFVGRESEIALLSRDLARAVGGHGGTRLVAGESGVGKSRLLDEVRTRALVQGVLVLRGQAVGEGRAPYDLWRGIARRLILIAEPDNADAAALKFLVPDIETLLRRPVPNPPPMTPQAAGLRLLTALENRFREAGEPILVIIEDLQWADGDSLNVLLRLTALAAELPLLIVGSYRDDEHPDLHKLLPNARHMKLERLDADETARLAEAMLGLGGRDPALQALLQRETEGNAFFLVEVVRALAEEAGRLDEVVEITLPEDILTGGVAGVINRRLGRVSAAARAMLEAAAVGGRVVDEDVLRAILAEAGVPEKLDGWLAECGEAAVLEIHDGEWRFAHNKLRDGVLSGISSERRRMLHRRTAQALEKVYELYPRQTAEALAYHWGRAEEPAREEHYAALAGEQALKEGAYEAAARFLQRALDLLDHPGTPKRKLAALKQNLGDAYMEIGRRVEAQALFRASLDLCRETGYRWGEAANLWRLGSALGEAGDVDGAAEYLVQALRTAVEARALTVALGTLAGMAGLLARAGDKAIAVEYAALVIHHPSADAVAHDLAERVLQGGRAALSAEAYAAACARGQRGDLKAVAGRILGEDKA